METIGSSGRHRLHWLSLNGDSPVGPQNRTRNDPIRVNSCPFVVVLNCYGLAAIDGLVSGQSSTPCGAFFLFTIGSMTAPKNKAMPMRPRPSQKVSAEPKSKQT